MWTASEVVQLWECTPCRCCFFFSSRRRHTRLQGDWSSDVCSSDLPEKGEVEPQQEIVGPKPERGGGRGCEERIVPRVRKEPEHAKRARDHHRVKRRLVDLWIGPGRVEADALRPEERDRLRVVDAGRESLAQGDLPAHVGLRKRRLARGSVELLPCEQGGDDEPAHDERPQPDPSRPPAHLEPVDQLLRGARADGHLSVTSSSGHWASLRWSVRRLIPINSAALVRFPRDLISASRRIRLSFCSTESVGSAPASGGPPDPRGESGAPRNRGSRSNSDSRAPLRSTTAFSQKLRSSRMFPGQE